MIFSSLVFIFRFLPIFFLIYYIVPRRFRNLVLFLGSLFFYAWGEPKYAVLILVSILANFLFAQGIHRCAGNGKKWILAFDIIFNVGMLAFFKYSNFVVDNISSLLGQEISFPKIALPLGISFYTFQIMSYVIDVYREKCKCERSIVRLGAYLCMFPQLIAGPIVIYQKVSCELRHRVPNIKGVENGLKLFVVGLGYKVLLANNLGMIWTSMEEVGYENLSTPLAWIGILSYTLQIYFDFNGYSLMAIGLGEMLGFTFPQNFNYPYIANSVTDFWKRWHITLTSWFREYIYIPLGGNRKGKVRTYVNLLIIWFITGLWHGAGWNFISWGLYYFVFIAIERLFLKKYLDKSKVLSRIYTLAVVMCGWVIFAITDMGNIGIYFSRLFSGFYSADYIPYLQSYWPLLAAGILFATPVFQKAYEKYKSHFIGLLVLLILFWASIVSLVDAVYNPFLYFRF